MRENILQKWLKCYRVEVTLNLFQFKLFDKSYIPFSPIFHSTPHWRQCQMLYLYWWWYWKCNIHLTLRFSVGFNSSEKERKLLNMLVTAHSIFSALLPLHIPHTVQHAAWYPQSSSAIHWSLWKSYTGREQYYQVTINLISMI